MSSSSSGEEDGDAEWKAAIDFVSSVSPTAPATTTSNNQRSQNQFKHYQLKAQQILNDFLEKTIEVVRSTDPLPLEVTADNGSGIQLFKHAPRGIVFDHTDEFQQPKKKPRLLPGKEIDEKSKKFKKQLQSVAVSGIDILAAARDADQKSLAKLKAREAAAKAAAKREEERVAELKKIRGERWLPCMATEGLAKSLGC